MLFFDNYWFDSKDNFDIKFVNTIEKNLIVNKFLIWKWNVDLIFKRISFLIKQQLPIEILNLIVKLNILVNRFETKKSLFFKVINSLLLFYANVFRNSILFFNIRFVF